VRRDVFTFHTSDLGVDRFNVVVVQFSNEGLVPRELYVHG